MPLKQPRFRRENERIATNSLSHSKKQWPASGQTTMKQVLGEDELGRIATSFF